MRRPRPTGIIMFTTARPVWLALLPLLLMPLCLLPASAAQAQGAQQIAQGQRIWQKRCAECHALDRDETGPRHRGVFGRRAGSIKGYDYSHALRDANLRWNEQTLERWLRDPEQFLPGQNMDFRLRSKAERDAVIAYLRSLSTP